MLLLEHARICIGEDKVKHVAKANETMD